MCGLAWPAARETVARSPWGSKFETYEWRRSCARTAESRLVGGDCERPAEVAVVLWPVPGGRKREVVDPPTSVRRYAPHGRGTAPASGRARRTAPTPPSSSGRSRCLYVDLSAEIDELLFLVDVTPADREHLPNPSTGVRRRGDHGRVARRLHHRRLDQRVDLLGVEDEGLTSVHLPGPRMRL